MPGSAVTRKLPAKKGRNVSAARREPQDEVEQLLLNARLRDELEPFLDESVEVVNTRVMPTDQENEYLASMLEWPWRKAISAD